MSTLLIYSERLDFESKVQEGERHKLNWSIRINLLESRNASGRSKTKLTHEEVYEL